MPFPGWFTHATSFCVGAAAAATAAAVLLQSSQTSRTMSEDAPTSRTDEEDGKTHPLARPSSTMQMLPIMPIRVFRPNDNLTIAFDTRSKNPLFVMERLTGHDSLASEKDSPDHHASRKNKRFHEESTLLPYHRSRNSNYRHSGYDRGHLAPAADFSLDDQEMNDTFVLTNISPQLPRFNRSIWLRLEEFVRNVAQKEGSDPTDSETWVITGPIWLPNSTIKTDSGDGDSSRFQYSYEGIGKPPSLVAVPTHFYKVLAVVEKRPKKQSAKSGGAASQGNDSEVDGDEDELVLKSFAAFVLPNSNFDGENNGIRLINCTVRLTDLEAITGLEFFPRLFGLDATNSGANNANDVPLRKEIADALTDDVRFHGKKTIKSGEQNHRNSSALVPLSSSTEEWSKGRQKKVKQVLSNNAPLPFQHLCRKNEACFKLLRV